MLIPSIDIVDGRAVQLIGGEEEAIDGGDPMEWLDRFSLFGEVAVVDIDAARGEGDNRGIIEEMCRNANVRVGGGIRDLETAHHWLNVGAARIVLGSAATPELLAKLPGERTVAAIDSRDSRVLSQGWRTETGIHLLSHVEALAPYCGGILVTFVEREGRLAGTDLERAREVVARAGESRVTVAGGISTTSEIAGLDSLGADAQVGMALYTGALDLADAFAAPLRSDRPDGLWPTVIVDESGVALGLAYSSIESVRASLESGTGVYQSRTRGLWRKGESSEATQTLLEIVADCDRDTLRFTVSQEAPGFCHTGTRTCWDDDAGLTRLARRLESIPESALGTGSNTARLLTDPVLLAAKLAEEAAELATADIRDQPGVAHEAADLIYFTLVKAVSAGVDLAAIEAELDRRALRVTRRPMEVSP